MDRFFAEGRLRRTPVGGGPPVDIARVPLHTFGASWGPDDRIVLVWVRSPLHVVDAEHTLLVHTIAPVPLTQLEPGESGHYRPEILPDGRTLLFDTGSHVHALDLETGRRTALVEGVAPRYAATGHLVVGRGPTLLAAPFDPSRAALIGPVVPLVDGVASTGSVGNMQYAISRTGTLAYLPAATRHASWTRAMTSASSREDQLSFENPQFWPDGQRLAVATRRRAGESTEIRVHDLEALARHRGSPTTGSSRASSRST